MEKHMKPGIRVQNLFVRYHDDKKRAAVGGISFFVSRGECLCLLGESGSGKSSIAKALIGILPVTANVSGFIDFFGERVDLGRKTDALLSLRGRKIGYIFQDSQQALNPMRTIREHFRESVLQHGLVGEEEIDEIGRRFLGYLNFEHPERVLGSYPFQLSGGMCQRVYLALSLCLEPKLLIADETTSALDRVNQMEVMRLLNKSRRERNLALLFITHDLALARAFSDRVLVMRDGTPCEEGPSSDVFRKPSHPYTCALLSASLQRPSLEDRLLVRRAGALPEVESSPPSSRQRMESRNRLLEVRNLTKRYDIKGRAAVDRVSFGLDEGEVMGVLGESGCGKSSLAKCIAGIEGLQGGEVLLCERRVDLCRHRRDRSANTTMQIIFQDGRASLNPRRKVVDLIQEPNRYLGLYSCEESRRLASALLDEVGLGQEVYRYRAPQLSTGQCQRVAIARALFVRPKLLICDEPVSSLDVRLQNQILGLLLEIHRERGIAILMISHDIGLLKSCCQRIAVMKDGVFCEVMETRRLCEEERHPYTERLLACDRTLHTQSAFS